MGRKARLKRQSKDVGNEIFLLNYLIEKGLDISNLPTENTEETCPFKEICHENPLFGKVLHSNLEYEEMIPIIGTFIKAWELCK